MLDELLNLLEKLGVAHDFDLLGHSWGGMLGVELLIRCGPQVQGLRRLILSSALSSMDLWMKVTMEMLKAFPDWVREGFMAGFQDVERLRPAAQVFFAKHGCRVTPFPEECNTSVEYAYANPYPHFGL
jgi:pimeloyl-ACP methyl ester carboxylesterase